MARYDHRSAEARQWRKLYRTVRWQRLRERQLSAEPLCRYCLVSEDITVADVVDHIKEHKGDERLFFDADNLQSLCKQHHDSTKQREERGQTVIHFGPDGWPV